MLPRMGARLADWHPRMNAHPVQAMGDKSVVEAPTEDNPVANVPRPPLEVMSPDAAIVVPAVTLKPADT